MANQNAFSFSNETVSHGRRLLCFGEEGGHPNLIHLLIHVLAESQKHFIGAC